VIIDSILGDFHPVVSLRSVDDNFFNIVFMVVIASLVLQGWTIPWLARRLDLEDRNAAPVVPGPSG
jgi:cell volume regulation protein A